MNYSAMRYAMLFSALIFQTSNGYADIGGIGSPVVPSNGPAQTQNNPIVTMQQPGAENKPAAAGDASKPATLATTAAAEAKTIFTQEFSQHRISYDSELKAAVMDAERENPRNRDYTVTSTYPANINKKDLGDGVGVAYQTNLADVVMKITSYGVPAEKVHAVTDPSADARTQQISVSVK